MGHKILVSHESPISILDHSVVYNDYDYALVHLFEKYPQYYDFFKKSLTRNREVLLDNSIFELGTAFDSDKFQLVLIFLIILFLDVVNQNLKDGVTVDKN